jgi:DNA-binding MarR family transcriptional regulator
LVQHEVGERLVAQVPDVPRILSRMEKAGWITRCRGTVDRRTVYARLTPRGLKLVNELDDKMTIRDMRLFSAMTREELERLCELLVLARGSAAEE